MVSAGKLRDRFTFQKDEATADWTGHPAAPDWKDKFTVWGTIEYSRGGESVMAARLTARQPAILTVRNTSDARQVEPNWRVKDARTGEIFNIRETPREAKESRGFLQMLVEAGASDG